MKNECAIVRDLMPLCIDGAASEESRRFTQEHIRQCPGCAEIYGEMRAELRFQSAQEEKAVLERAAKRVKRKRTRRRAWLALICLVLGAVLCYAGIEWYGNYYLSYDQTMSASDYRVELLRSTDGAGLAVFYLQEDSLICLPTMYTADLEDGTVSICISLLTTRRPVYMEEQEIIRANAQQTMELGQWSGGSWMMDHKLVSKVWVEYGSERQLLYSPGDAVPFCSSEMRAYYELYHGDAGDMTPQEYLRELLQRRDAVPEWQPR